jgi:hypothetical protein
VGPLEVDAEHAIARLLEKAYDLPPARGIVPAFGLQRVLHRDADIGLGYGRLRSGMAMRLRGAARPSRIRTARNPCARTPRLP